MRLLIVLFTLSPLWLFAQDVAEAARADGDAALHRARRGHVAQLLRHPRSPLDSHSIQRLRFFPPNDTFRVATVILPLADTATVEFVTSDGLAKAYRPYAKLYFRLGGSLRDLTVYESPDLRRNPLLADKLFLPFRDETNGFESYGGGRYLDVSRRAVDARDLVLDFNRAYNPWCAYGEGFSCPVPPPANSLPVAVLAGEAALAASEARPPLAPAEPQ